MLWDKILFVIKLQKLKKQVSFCYPSRMWETHPNDYWVFSKMADLLYHSFPGPSLSKMATESNFPPWERSGCQIPCPRALHWVYLPWVAHPSSCGKPLKGALAHLSMVCPTMGGGATHGNRWLDVVDLLLISVCSIEPGDTEKKTSEKFV